MFDYGYPNWGEIPPFHAPVVVVTHRGPERIDKSGGTSYTFVTGGIKAAVEQARAVADGKDVLLAGGVSIAQQALAAELVDEVVLHVVPKLVETAQQQRSHLRALPGRDPRQHSVLLLRREGRDPPGHPFGLLDRRARSRRHGDEVLVDSSATGSAGSATRWATSGGSSPMTRT